MPNPEVVLDMPNPEVVLSAMAAPSATAGNMAANLILGEFFDKTTWQPQLAAWWTAQQAAGTAAPAPSATAGNMAANLNGQSASSSHVVNAVRIMPKQSLLATVLDGWMVTPPSTPVAV